jgi:hypothetical protein
MRVLLLHPEDSPRRGPWSRQRWDLIVDLGKSSPGSAAAWQEQMRCPILRADSFRRGVDDLRIIREMFSFGRRRLLDDEGIDWWDLTSLVVAPQMEDALLLRRIASEINTSADVWATRPGWPGNGLSFLLKRPVNVFSTGSLSRWASRPAHYAQMLRRFSPAEIRQILLDKYDAGYYWRSKCASAKKALPGPLVLLPSAYENVSRMSAAYARLLPDQPFLLVATRQSARKFVPPQNVHVRDLTGYAKAASPTSETTSILANWEKLKVDLRAAAPEFTVPLEKGVFDSFPQWFHDCLRARDAWREVLDREPVTAVLCGDDSNIYTRLPVLLAARRKIPTVDFHHGALDGRYILKDLPCDAYLVKTAMERDYLTRVCGLASERLVDGAPPPSLRVVGGNRPPAGTSAILFSEAYENAGLRAEEIYREILPPLCRMASETRHSVLVKLHPFESAAARKRLIRSLLSPQDFKLVTVVEGPSSLRLFAQAWFGITIESTAALECLSAGVPCFLCGWLKLSSYGYVEQYARFNVGETLRNPEEIGEIPSRVTLLQNAAKRQQGFGSPAKPEDLRQLLFTGSLASVGARRIS